jgi:hypothetical protein
MTGRTCLSLLGEGDQYREMSSKDGRLARVVIGRIVVARLSHFAHRKVRRSLVTNSCCGAICNCARIKKCAVDGSKLYIIDANAIRRISVACLTLPYLTWRRSLRRAAPVCTASEADSKALVRMCSQWIRVRHSPVSLRFVRSIENGCAARSLILNQRNDHINTLTPF